VDEDKDGALARAAVSEHQANINVYAATSTVPFRDSIYAPLNKQTYFAWNLTRFAEGINKSAVALYQFAGWYDMYPRDQAAWFNNLTIPQRILFTPFSHAIGTDSGWKQFIPKIVNDDFTTEELHRYHIAEHLRFWDYYLKGIDNGIRKEPPVWYYVMGAPAGQAWRSSDRWPLANEVRTKYYLQGGPSGSIASVNDGLLSVTKPTAAGKDDYRVDYTTTSGKETRWHDGHGGRFFYPNMSEQGKKSLTYTTIPLKVPVEITGHPVMHFWMTASSEDADVFAYIEEVDETGYAYYVTEGMLRASHRTLSEPPFKYMGLPYHRSFKEDISPLPKGERVELVFELLPTSNIFDAGHRIRVRIVGADTDNFTTPRQDPAPVISVYRDASNVSFIELPIIPMGK
jgi:putative CocE/NonD family hydrolase